MKSLVIVQPGVIFNIDHISTFEYREVEGVICIDLIFVNGKQMTIIGTDAESLWNYLVRESYVPV